MLHFNQIIIDFSPFSTCLFLLFLIFNLICGVPLSFLAFKENKSLFIINNKQIQKLSYQELYQDEDKAYIFIKGLTLKSEADVYENCKYISNAYTSHPWFVKYKPHTFNVLGSVDFKHSNGEIKNIGFNFCKGRIITYNDHKDFKKTLNKVLDDFYKQTKLPKCSSVEFHLHSVTIIMVAL